MSLDERERKMIKRGLVKVNILPEAVVESNEIQLNLWLIQKRKVFPTGIRNAVQVFAYEYKPRPQT